MQTSTILLIVIEVVLLVLALADLLKRKFKNLAFGLVWLLIILFIPIVGAVVYLYLRKGMSAGTPKAFNPAFHPREEKEKPI